MEREECLFLSFFYPVWAVSSGSSQLDILFLLVGDQSRVKWGARDEKLLSDSLKASGLDLKLCWKSVFQCCDVQVRASPVRYLYSSACCCGCSWQTRWLNSCSQDVFVDRKFQALITQPTLRNSGNFTAVAEKSQNDFSHTGRCHSKLCSLGLFVVFFLT